MAELFQFKKSMASSVDGMTDEEKKSCVIDLLSEVNREGMDKLIGFLTNPNKSDYFTAPASTRFHLSVPGGLVTHSLHVYYRLYELMAHDDNMRNGSSREVMDSIAIVGLLHDLCKVNFYKQVGGSRKTGQYHPNGKPVWEEYLKYEVDDQMPMGHGEKSLYMIQGFIRLTREEAMAIRWHMGFTDNDFKAGGYSLQKVFETYPLALAAHIADIQASYIDEVTDGGNH